MIDHIKIWIRKNSRRIVNSIAFYPAFIALLFLIVSVLMITLDYSESGKKLKESLHWLSLKDASTTRTIISCIVAGIISLTVFSFSMVMIVLNQAASQLSNRVLDDLIGNRFQQVVLGVYIGTIVFALFLLSTIRDLDTGLHIPALSTYLLIMITVFDIFLFIYFLHYVTQSVKYQVIIERIYHKTKNELLKSCSVDHEYMEHHASGHDILTNTAGIYHGFDKEALLNFCTKHNIDLALLQPVGTYLLRGIPFALANRPLTDEEQQSLLKIIYLQSNETIEGNYYYGFHQLVEVAVKALSAGINDPATAILCLRGLFELLSFHSANFPPGVIKDDNGEINIFIVNHSFETIFANTILPIWDHGKNDRMLHDELHRMLSQLYRVAPYPIIRDLIAEMNTKKHEFFIKK